MIDGEELSPEAQLFDEGYLDSLGTLGLIDLLEQTFEITLPAEVLLDPGFASVEGIADLVAGYSA